MPTWIVLLAALPFTGLGVLACLTLATALAIAVVIVAERMRGRGPRAAGEPRAGGRFRSMSPLAAAGLTLGVVALLVYVVFVIRAG